MRAVRVTGFDEGEVGQVSRFLNGPAAFQKPRADDRRQLLAKQPHSVAGHGRCRAVTDGQVDVGHLHVDRHVGGVDADVDIGVGALEHFHARDQPHGCERSERGDGDTSPPGALADLPHRAVDLWQRPRDGPKQQRARARQLDRARVPQEKRGTHIVFKRLNLAAHSRLRQRHFFRCRAEIQVPRHRLKGAQVARRNRAAAQMGLGVLHGNSM